MIADTDVLIDLLLGVGAAAQVVRLASSSALATTAVNVYELYRGCRSEDERERLRMALRGVRVYPLSDQAARRAAEVDRELTRRGRGIGERDTLVAGVALATGLPVLTANVKHFRRVAGLRVVKASR
jgi:tRNA(fMet)-specific endonuclease VapC